MKIIIAGCGKIGTTIVASLIAEGHDVVVIDKNADVLNDITNLYDVMAVCGNCTDCDTLEEADASTAELFVAVTDSDELNMLSCFLAKKLGSAHTIARIRNPEYNDKSLSFVKQQLDLSMSINPDLLAAQEIYNDLKLPSAAKVETFSRRIFKMVEVNLHDDSVLDGISLINFRKKYQLTLLVCVVQRGDEVYIPDGNFILNSGDRIGVIASSAELQKFFKLIDETRRPAKDVMILGASRIAQYLSTMLISSGTSVKVVDINRNRCEEFCEAVPSATVINGDGANQELLTEEGIGSTDAFVSLTGMDEENILISYYAASQKVPKIVSKINREEFFALAERLGLECIVSPQNIVSDILVRYARALQNSLESQIETLYKLMDGKAEAIEFIVKPDCPAAQIPFKDISLKKNILIAGIIRGRKPIVPDGNDMMLPGDHVIVIAAGHRLEDLSDILN